MSVEANYVQMREVSATSWSYETKLSLLFVLLGFFPSDFVHMPRAGFGTVVPV